MVEFRSQAEVQKWLANQPKEVAGVLAVRCALRVAPLMALAISRETRKQNVRAAAIVLPWFRGLAAPWVAAVGPTHGAEAMVSTSFAASASAAAAAAAGAAAAARARAAAARAPAYAAADAYASAAAAAADAAYAAAYAAEARARAAASAYAAARGVADADIFFSLSADANALENGVAPEKLALRELWPARRPNWSSNHWRRLKRALDGFPEDENWWVWRDWYEARLEGGPVDRDLETQRVLIADELWQQGPKVANAEIARLIEGARQTNPSIPEPPLDGPGPRLVLTPDGFETDPILPGADEFDDATQKSLHRRLKTRVERLKQAMPRVQNTHKALYDEFSDYAMFVAEDLQDIDVPSLWSVGAALSDMVGKLAELSKPGAVHGITEPLEPDVLSQLVSLTRDHAAFIMGFSEAEKLSERVAKLKLLDVGIQEFARLAHGVLVPMLRTRLLLARRAHALVDALSRALDSTDDKTVALIGAGVATATRAVIAFGRAVAPYAPYVAVFSGITGVTALTLAGDPNGEAIRAALRYLSENADALSAFATHNEQLKIWLDWLVGEIRAAAKEEPTVQK